MSNETIKTLIWVFLPTAVVSALIVLGLIRIAELATGTEASPRFKIFFIGAVAIVELACIFDSTGGVALFFTSLGVLITSLLITYFDGGMRVGAAMSAAMRLIGEIADGSAELEKQFEFREELLEAAIYAGNKFVARAETAEARLKKAREARLRRQSRCLRQISRR